MSEQQPQPSPLYHAYDGDGHRMKDKFGTPRRLRAVGSCCQHDVGSGCRQVRCYDVNTKEMLWFFPSSLREIKETTT